MLSWEFPPRKVGQVSDYVSYLALALYKMGNEVHVITCEEGNLPLEEKVKGIYVHRVIPYAIETDDFVKWTMQLNFAMAEEAIRVIEKFGKFNIIHAHDWLTAYTSKLLKYSYNIPIVCTIHETEYMRNNGINTDMQRYISNVESMLIEESWRVVVKSDEFKQHINELFQTPVEKICVMEAKIDEGFSRAKWTTIATTTCQMYESVFEETKATPFKVTYEKPEETVVKKRKRTKKVVTVV